MVSSEGPRNTPPRGTNLPSLQVKGMEIAKAFLKEGKAEQGGIPNASLIYGVASAALLSFGLYHLLTGGWVTFLLLAVLAGVLFGFALYFLRHPV